MLFALTTAFMAPAVAPMKVGTSTVVMNEAAAKAAWLAKLDAPQWGPKGGAMSTRRQVGRVVPTARAAPVAGRRSMTDHLVTPMPGTLGDKEGTWREFNDAHGILRII